jgi:hypothetical protein
MDDTEREGEKDTIRTICETLEDEYTGEKNQHTVICSEDLKFLTSLR